MLAELNFSEKANFVTLTYDDENLPFDLSLDKEHIQNFLKLLRYHSGSKIRYFLCGEYGEKTNRAHYHIILFHNIENLKEEIDKCWKKGMSHIGLVSPASIRYVLNYIKKEQAKKIGFNYVTKPFQLMSKGLGLRYLQKNEEKLIKRGYLIIDGYKYSIPRYYRKKSDALDEKVRLQIEEQNDKRKAPTIQEVDKSLALQPSKDRQLVRNILAKKSIKQGKL